MGRRLGDELALLRSARFAGRRAERELFGAALADDVPPWSVLWLHGPGGIGKSSLLEMFAEMAGDADAAVVEVDGRSLVDGGDPPLAALRSKLVVAEPATGERRLRLVLLVDSFEWVAEVEDDLRRDVVPRLSDSALVVIASRHAPAEGWRADPAWRERLRIVSLRNLSPHDATEYLDRCGVEPRAWDGLVEVSHGHPLALSLLADLAVRDGVSDQGEAAAMLEDPDLVATLLRRLIDGLPSSDHRRALEVCAIARVTTQDLLQDALAIDDCAELFDWLRRQSYVEVGKEGVWPHDLVRDVIDVDLRWRDPAAYKEVFRRVRAHIHRRLENMRGAEQRRAIADEKFVFRNLPSVLSPVDWSIWGHVDTRPARPDDRDTIIGLIREFEGADSAQIAAQWWERQPEAFFVVPERDGTVRGFVALVSLTAPQVGDLSFDPGAWAAMRFAERNAPVRTGETMTQTRFVVDREHYQMPSPTLNSVPILNMQRYLQMPELAWDFLTLVEPDALDEYFAIADLPRAAGADFEIGGRRFGLFAHDFRRVPVNAWLETVTERALAQDPAEPAGTGTELVVLSYEAFAEAVRRALRDLNRPDELARNPLTGARVVSEHGEGHDHAEVVLATLLAEAISDLDTHPTDSKRRRALEQTYVRPAPSQERAAEALGLPFSTYRRHLTEGVDRVVTQLWDLELHGPSADRQA